MTRALVLASLLLATAAQAAGEVVVLETRGGPEERAQVEASVGELLRRLKVLVATEAEPGQALARVDVELAEVECAVTVHDRRGALVEYRRVARSSSSQVTVEAVAHVVQSAIEALAELERAPPVTRAVIATPLSAPPVVAAPVDAATPAVGVELGAFVGGRAFGDGAPFVFGGGVLASLRLEREGAWTPRFSLLGAYNGPFTATSNDVQLSTQSATVRALGGARLSLGRLAFDGQLAVGFDSLFTDARSTTLAPADLRDRHSASPVVGAMLTARVLLTPTTEVMLAATVDVDLLPRRFVSDITGTRTVLFETWRVRPAVLLGFSFDVVGARRLR